MSEQGLNVTSATPEITVKQQQASNNSLLASLLNDICTKPFKHGVFYLAGLAAAGIFILFITGINANTWCGCRVAISGRWLDLCFKRERQSLAVFFDAATVACVGGVLMRMNVCRLIVLCCRVGEGVSRRRRWLPAKALGLLSYVNGRGGGGGGEHRKKNVLHQSV